jgi:hypothetical protein
MQFWVKSSDTVTLRLHETSKQLVDCAFDWMHVSTHAQGPAREWRMA